MLVGDREEPHKLKLETRFFHLPRMISKAQLLEAVTILHWRDMTRADKGKARLRPFGLF